MRYVYNNIVFSLVRRFPNCRIIHWLEKFLYDTEGNRLHMRCQDCGRPYGDSDWIDVIISDEQWKAIGMPADGGGLLCGACIIRRGVMIPGVTHARLEFRCD
jgi:hypothetical protein